MSAMSRVYRGNLLMAASASRPVDRPRPAAWQICHTPAYRKFFRGDREVWWRLETWEIREDSGRLEVRESQGGSGGGNQGRLGESVRPAAWQVCRAMPARVQGTMRRYYASFPSA